ncbi:hypothetical protein KIL84_007449 [Mauremys mutica]|uniref:Uncharacterized protein n=1 Tax=Mauremys mutica TaxID=74926 RepID=A0A9D3X1W7_9SAUR|nr:hypothetical protein KIL84_007449 [Mauremys mutica]
MVRAEKKGRIMLLVSYYVGQDTMDASIAFHINKTLVRKSMNLLLIGELALGQPSFEPCKNGFSSTWRNCQHNQHHAKTNCFPKDPDILLHPSLFALGKTLSVELGMVKKKLIPSAQILHHSPLCNNDIMTKKIGDKFFELIAYHIQSTECAMLSLPQKLLVEDFRELRATIERMELLNPNSLFFFLIFLQILLLEATRWITLWYFGTSLLPFLISAVLLTTSLLGMKKKFMPYNHQHKYFFVTNIHHHSSSSGSSYPTFEVQSSIDGIFVRQIGKSSTMHWNVVWLPFRHIVCQTMKPTTNSKEPPWSKGITVAH